MVEVDCRGVRRLGLLPVVVVPRSLLANSNQSSSLQSHQAVFSVSESHTHMTQPQLLSGRLDALETSPQTKLERCICGPEDASDDVGVDFRHSGWRQNRHRVQSAMDSLDTAEARRLRFDSCGSRAWVLQSVDEPELFKIACDRCRDRFCVPCARERSRHIASKVGDFATGKELRFITLTLRHTTRTMKEDVDRLYAGFVKLRRRRLWCKSQKGGIGFLEIKRAENGQCWHVHIHTICEGRNIEKRNLSKAWHNITGDSFIVDVKFCHSPESAAWYAAKYSGKGIHGSCYDDQEVLADAMRSIKGRRLVAKFGTWSALDLKENTDEGEWRGVDSLRRLIARSAGGDSIASAILVQLKGEAKCSTEPRSPPDPGGSPFLFDMSHAAPAVRNSCKRS